MYTYKIALELGYRARVLIRLVVGLDSLRTDPCFTRFNVLTVMYRTTTDGVISWETDKKIRGDRNITLASSH